MRLLRAAGAVLASVVVLSGAHSARADADDMPGHMTMTAPRPAEPGDQQRAAEIVAAARRFAEPYRDYRKALADGYTVFHPEIPQHVYHFTDNAAAGERTRHFDPAHPMSLLYERTAPETPGGAPGYRLVGVMYMAPFRDTPEELNALIPLSVARWHLHTNLCLPPEAGRGDILSRNARFGLNGSITTVAACDAAGGTFISHVFGWMVHVYPFETDPAKIWASGMDDEHGMSHDAMPAGMPM